MELALILITGTLPPRFNGRLVKFFFVTNPIVYRQHHFRANLKYSVKVLDDYGEMYASFTQYQRGLYSKYGDKEEEARFIVYCATKKEAEKLQKVLKSELDPTIECYHAAMAEKSKEKVLEQWRDGNTKLATSAFGMGIDYPAVRAVTIFGGCYGFLDVIQQFGRAGRDGEESFCSLYTSNSYLNRLKLENSEQQSADILVEEFKYMKLFVDDIETCRRWRITEYLDGDGQGVTCHVSTTCLKCDICDKGCAVIEDEKKEVYVNRDVYNHSGILARATLHRIELDGAQLRSMLQQFKYLCMPCLIVDANPIKNHVCKIRNSRCLRCFSIEHSANKCPIERKLVQGICSYCYLPCKIGSSFFHESGQFGSRCKNGFQDIIRDATLSLPS